MTAHTHRTYVPGCYRCELGLDEARDAARDAEREAIEAELLARIRERVMNFGGIQRSPVGAFWISRDDVLRLIDEMVP